MDLRRSADRCENSNSPIAAPSTSANYTTFPGKSRRRQAFIFKWHPEKQSWTIPMIPDRAGLGRDRKDKLTAIYTNADYPRRLTAPPEHA
jgi:hypothetical protein